MSEVVKYVDLCIANEEDAEKVFGIKAQGSDITSGKLNEAGYHDVIHQLVDRFGFKYVAAILRESFSASHNGWSDSCTMARTSTGLAARHYRSWIVSAAAIPLVAA